MDIWKMLLCYRRGLMLVLTPLLLLPLPLMSPSASSNCAYVMLIMFAYWISGSLHLAVVSVFPIVFFPLLGIMDTNAICMTYMRDTNVVYLACVILGIAIEHSKLHRRMALVMLLKIGTSPRMLLLGVMLTTMMISMWIMNTVAAAMMIPIVEAIFENLEKLEAELYCNSSENVELKLISGSQSIEESWKLNFMKRQKKSLKYKKCILLSVAYAANIGGTGTSTSTSPNIVFTQIVTMLYGHQTGMSYAKWMLFGVPNMLCCIFASYILLVIFFMGFKPLDDSKLKAEVAKKTLTAEYAKLGSLTFHEGSVLTCFITLVVLFFFRNPYFMPGWENILSSGKKITDAVPAMLLVLFMCAFPAFPAEAFNSKSDAPASSLLSWETIQEKLPWDLILLQGSGYALAAGFKESGLDAWLADQFVALESIPPTALCFVLALVASFVTEVASNASTAAILLPVVAKMAENLGVHPLYLMIPVCICSSFSFMLPVATGPNAMVFKSGKMKSKDMFHVGFLNNCICVVTLFAMLNSLGTAVFGLDSFPDWALMADTHKPQLGIFSNTTLNTTIKINP